MSWTERDVPVYIKHRGAGVNGISGTVHVQPHHPLRRRRLGRLPVALRLQHQRLRAADWPGAPAPADPPGVRGAQRHLLQLRAAQGRLPPARDPGALLPLQRRLATR
ncbi:MAG: hypothetical protein V9F04_00675 [Dermatophilaceae bacterium]